MEIEGKMQAYLVQLRAEDEDEDDGDDRLALAGRRYFLSSVPSSTLFFLSVLDPSALSLLRVFSRLVRALCFPLLVPSLLRLTLPAFFLLSLFFSVAFSGFYKAREWPFFFTRLCLVSGAVATEDGALKLLLLEATKTVVTLVVTLVYCFPWSSFSVSSAQDINDGDEDVRCCRLNGSLLPSVFFFVCFSALDSVTLRLP